MRGTAADALAHALGLPTPAPRDARAAAPVRVGGDARRRATRADPQTTSRTTERLPGEALAAGVDTNPVLVRIAREVAASLRAGRARRPRRGGGRARRRVRSRGVCASAAITSRSPTAATASASRSPLRSTITLDAVLLLPERLGRRGAGRAGDGGRGRQVGRAGRPRGGGGAGARLGGAGARPARHRRERRVASSSWRRPRGCSIATCWPTASTTCASCVRHAVGAVLDGPADRQAAHRRARRRAVRAGGAAGRGARRRHRRRRRHGLRREPRGAARREPADHADGVPVRRAGDLRRARSGAARPPRARRRPAPTTPARSWLDCSRRWDRDRRPRRHRGRRPGVRVRAARRAAHHPPGRDRRRRTRRWWSTRAFRARRPTASCRCWRGSALPPIVLLTHPDGDHVAGTAEVLAAYPGSRVVAGADDIALMGVPERAIRERYARFAAFDDVPFTEEMHARAVARFGDPFDPPEPVAGRHDARPRRPLRDAARDARSQPGPHRRVGGGRRRAGSGRRRDGPGDHRPGGQLLHPRHVRAALHLPRDRRRTWRRCRSRCC